MCIKFAFDFINHNRPGRKRSPVICYDKVYSSLHKTMMDLKQGRDNPKESHFNLQMVQQLLSSYKPDLNIVCEDEESIQTYKLLLGMTSKLLGDIFLHEDFVTESVTTVLVPLHSNQVKVILNCFEKGTENPPNYDLFSASVSSPSNTKAKDTSGLTENTFNNEMGNFKPEEAEAEDNIKVENKGEFQTQAKPVLKKVQCATNKSNRTKHPMTKCLKCGRKYRFINKHTQENCDKVIKRRNIISKKSLPCELCGKIMTKPNLRFHMRSWHNPEEAESYNCDQCDYVTKKQARFHLHMNIHGRVTLEPCHICGGKYKRLDWHIKRNHSNDPKNLLVNCEICGKEFQRSHISKHKKNMHMERKFGCHLCSYKAQTSYNLKLHISKSHLGVKELEKEQCPHCDVLTTNLPYHLKIYHP